MKEKQEQAGECNLVHAAQQGDRQAMAELLAGVYPAVLNYLIKLSRDRSLAEDLTQEALLRALLHLCRFRPEARFSTWVLAIATNLYRDHCRKAWRETPASDTFQAASEGEGSWPSSAPPGRATRRGDPDARPGSGAGGPDPGDAALQHLEYEGVLRALAALAPEKRAVFILNHYEGLHYHEIAALLHCPEGTVKSRLHQAVQELRRFLRAAGW